ncbi:MAG: tRNA preQ1(34) S-adenosylmethionine ribosyltransferase-isomerase QueA [Acidobacteria bacterium]|nr:tRNA preQ1(34) S-adenosylmethionine ribosyltransferase-isomerase QueA [Acidobacteriota bacterium]
MKLSDFNYHLPEDLIAQQPAPDRAASRMLVVHRDRGCWEDRCFFDLPAFLSTGDCLALNDTRVFPSRLFGHRSGVFSLPVGRNNPKRNENLSARVEVFLLRAISADAKTWEALVRPGRKMRTGERIEFSPSLNAEIIARGEFGERTLRFEAEGDVYREFDQIGHVPLPPYIRRSDQPEDRERYQTVFARQRGSVAAPTAGLHFTPAMLDHCRAAGADAAFLTLHVGLGTFQPIHEEEFERHALHSERYELTGENASRIAAARRVIAVGTTSVRTLESVARSGELGASSGETDIFIYPGFNFRVTGAMLTNFHLPKSSLLLLVAAFAGRELILDAYRHAVESRYRFFSYGDCTPL